MAREYDGYFNIEHMIKRAMSKHLAFVIAVSEDAQRGCGKSYSSALWLLKSWLEKGERFIILVRDVRELGHICEGIFGMALSDNYQDYNIYERNQKDIFSYVYLEKGVGEEKTTDLIGFVCCLKNAKKIKNYRGLMQSANVRWFMFDEFQDRDNKYLDDEVGKFKMIYDTVNGKIENLICILTANTINIGNEWFRNIYNGEGKRLTSLIQSNTRRLETDTFIYENVHVKNLDKKHMESAMNVALKQNNEEYSSNAWIGDDNSLVAKVDNYGRANYIATLVYDNDTKLAVLSYPQVNLYYINRKIDSSCPYVYNLKVDANLNIPLLKSNPLMSHLRECFYKGEVRVADNSIQRLLLDTL